ncbi:alpha/beta hydrolase [Nocardiopsis sp. HNM0947]|uniref:Alpha/beta hydrolase n=2 Tax=Nocardiopsis coralli TaxID=2772213 RepID=A0ABR9P239_9ACTN|nr:alpha/beta hydrolase [Nocardiopsis coralli]
MTGPEARAAVDARQAPPADHGEVHAAQDRTIAGPGGDLPVRVYTPHGDAPGGDPRPLMVFAHGGGFVFCSVDSHDGFCREAAASTGAVVVSVGYRLAPEHPAPAAAEDFYAALCWAVEHARELHADPARVAVAGDSAGGNLAAVACLLARERSGPRVAAQALLYPVIDPACDTPSHHRYATGHFNTRAAMRWYWRQYLHGGADDGGDPAIPAHHTAPLRAPSLRGLPPAVVVTADRDPLSDEGGAYASALAGAGVPVVHRRYPGLFHGFATIAPLGAAASARALLWHDLGERLAPDPSISSDEGKARA